jgi:Mycotoxin biosynthesis protein UstYa
MYQLIKDTDFIEDEEKHHHFTNGGWRGVWNFRNLQTFADKQKASNLILIIVNLVLLVTLMGTFFLSFQNFRELERNGDNRLIKITSTYCKYPSSNIFPPITTVNKVSAPIFGKLPISLTTRKSNGSFWPQNPPSVYQLPPSPEVDAAWSRLSDTHGIALTAFELESMGKKAIESWPYPRSYHIPGRSANETTYLGLINVFHQIHCLDIFRKLAWPDYYGEFWTHTSAFPFQEHVGHCQYMLLQTLMCHADLEIITFGKVRGTPGPFPDFSVVQKCRDFDGILKWKEDNQVNVADEEWKEIMVTPEEIVELEPEGRTLPPL